MSTRTIPATAVLVTTAVLWVAAVGLIAVSVSVAVPSSWGFRGSQLLFSAASGSVGAIVLRRRPESVIGWILAAIGLCFAVEAVVEAYTIVSVVQSPGTLPGQPWIGWMLTWLWIPPIALSYIYLPLLFPTGHVPTPHWRPVAWLGAIGCLTFAAATSIAPGPIQQATYLVNPFQPLGPDPGSASALEGVGVLPFAVAMILAVASVIRRFRTADDITRRQIKWFALSATIAGGTFAFYVSTYLVAPETGLTKVGEILVVLSLMTMPIAIGIAVLRYRLYEIDRIISRTLGWAVVTGLLVALFVGLVVGLQGALSGVTQGQTLAVAASTLAAAALFQPVRERVQRAVDRRFDRARYDAERTAAAFADRLRDETDIATVSDDLTETTGAALSPTVLGIWLREGSR